MELMVSSRNTNQGVNYICKHIGGKTKMRNENKTKGSSKKRKNAALLTIDDFIMN